MMREYPPLKLSTTVASPSGYVSRWGTDEFYTDNILNDLNFSTNENGFEQFSCKLARDPRRNYFDLDEYSKVVVSGIGGIVWEGRLESSPRRSGDELLVSPAAVGYQKYLEDNKSARMIYVDSSLANWGSVAASRKATMYPTRDVDDPTTASDPDNPAIITALEGSWSRSRMSEALYDAKGIPITTVFYSWAIASTVSLGDPTWSWSVFLADDVVASAWNSSGELHGVSATGGGYLNATTATRVYATLQQRYDAAGGADGVTYAIFWGPFAVFGNHGLPVRGAWPLGVGVLASDVVKHAVSTWAPKLAMSRGGLSTIEDTSFDIPHLVFFEPTTPGNIVNEALKYESFTDWWVDEGPTMNLASQSKRGRDWRTRVGPSGLQETGPQVDQICNRVIVAFNNASGDTYTVGPTGSGASIIDDRMMDTSATNLATAAGEVVYPKEIPNIGVTTGWAAVVYGMRMLQERNAVNTSGQANIVGYIEDSDSGVLYPAHAMRGGDRVTFTDARDTRPRRLTRTQYSDESKTNTIDLDSPPQDLDASIARSIITRRNF